MVENTVILGPLINDSIIFYVWEFSTNNSSFETRTGFFPFHLMSILSTLTIWKLIGIISTQTWNSIWTNLEFRIEKPAILRRCFLSKWSHSIQYPSLDVLSKCDCFLIVSYVNFPRLPKLPPLHGASMSHVPELMPASERGIVKLAGVGLGPRQCVLIHSLQ